MAGGAQILKVMNYCSRTHFLAVTVSLQEKRDVADNYSARK
jgi:hypothetical protein